MQPENTAVQYLAMGPYCWGRGATRAEAVKNARQNWPRVHRVKRPSDKHFSIYTSAGTMTVDGMGSITTTAGTIEKIQTSLLATAD